MGVVKLTKLIAISSDNIITKIQTNKETFIIGFILQNISTNNIYRNTFIIIIIFYSPSRIIFSLKNNTSMFTWLSAF